MNQKTFNIISSNEFIHSFIKKVEISISKSLWRVCEKKISIGEFIKSSIDRKTRLIKSNRISVMFGEEIEEDFCSTLKNFGIKSKHIDNEVGDVKIENDIWEIKTSKESPFGKKSTHTIQGSTHSRSKCKRYIFIRYGIDVDKILVKPASVNNLINRLHISIHDNIVESEYWVGKHSDNNSRTVLKVPLTEFDKFEKGIVFGSLKRANKYLQFRTEEFILGF